MSLILVGFGGVLGAISRYCSGVLIARHSTSDIPISTLIINVVGSFILGIISNYSTQNLLDESSYYLFGIGFCGAFTTFSTFGYETMQLLTNKNYFKALIYIILSTVLSGFAAFVGLQF